MAIDNHKLLLVPEVLIETRVASVQANLNHTLRVVVDPSEVFVIGRDEGHVPIIDKHLTLNRLLFINELTDRHIPAHVDGIEDCVQGMRFRLYVSLAYLSVQHSDHFVLLHTPSGYVPTA